MRKESYIKNIIPHKEQLLYEKRDILTLARICLVPNTNHHHGKGWPKSFCNKEFLG